MGKKTKKSDFAEQKELCPHNMHYELIAEELDTDTKFGLKHEVVEERLTKFGPNIIPKVKGSVWEVYIAPLLNWLINIYLIVAIVMVILGIIQDTVFRGESEGSVWGQIGFWMAIIGVNIVFTIFQQIRAQFKLDALHKLSAPTSTVIRDGVPEDIRAEFLVPGDLIELDQGDRIPADSRIIYSSNCLVNESALTGESVAVEKTNTPQECLDEDTPISQRTNMLYTGTFLEAGRAIAIVASTGIYTELGKLSTELQQIGSNEIPIRSKVNRLAKFLGIAVVVFILVSVIYKIIFHASVGSLSDVAFLEDLILTVTTSMAIMPISIPLLTTLILLTGVLSMAKDRVIIRNLSAVETLGRSSILCSDKTGTITSNQMTIQRLWDVENFYGVSGVGYSNKGAIYPLGEKFPKAFDEYTLPDSLKPFAEGSSLEYLLIGGMLNNNAHLIVEEVFEPHHQVSWKTTGDPTDGAFLALFNKSGLTEKKIREKYGYLSEFNFDSVVKRMSKTYQDEEGYILFCKGATETVLPLCDRIGYPEKYRSITEEDKKKIMEYVTIFAAEGYRVISLANKPLAKETTLTHNRDDEEKELIYNGFVCMLDPARYGVKEAVNQCFQAGIIPIMITGDSPITAQAIAKEVGIIRGEELAVEGNQIKDLTEEEFFKTRIFARVSPQHKQVIAQKYQDEGKIVSMCGDGVNDALALTNADVGICMGISGTEVAKQASDVVIADDSFTSTVLGIREGRGLFDRIRVMIFFYITLNIAEAILYFATSFIPGFYIVNDFQRVYIFSTAHLIPPFAFIFDSIADEIMGYPPRDDEEIFNKRYVIALVILALSLAFSAGLVYLLGFVGALSISEFNLSGIVPEVGGPGSSPMHLEHAKARTMFVTVLVISESLIVLSLRRLNKSVFKSLKEDWKWLVIVLVTVVPVIHILLMYIPALQNLVITIMGESYNPGLMPLNILDWLVVLVAVAIPIVTMEVYKYFIRRRKSYY
ncbi:MAG: cation-transporting P-type ATPase [Candidatus Heimdallarchaeota archaeon]|nr:cation-transporting P-type ATPase [Candidatus Heimdallarchaeota archaeon]